MKRGAARSDKPLRQDVLEIISRAYATPTARLARAASIASICPTAFRTSRTTTLALRTNSSTWSSLSSPAKANVRRRRQLDRQSDADRAAHEIREAGLTGSTGTSTPAARTTVLPSA